MTASDIIDRCDRLAAAGWHPSVITLSWWQDRGWRLEIAINDKIEAGTPTAELPSAYDLPVPYEPRPSPPSGPMAGHPGVTIGGWEQAADYVEPIRASESYEEQAAAVIRDVARLCDGDRPDHGESDNRGTPWEIYGRRRWLRVRVWRWQTESMRALRARAKKQRGEQ